MEKKELKTTEAQRRASIKWKKENYSRIPLDVRPEYHEYLKARAKADGMTLGAWIKDAIELKATRAADELPPDLIPRCMEWLQAHGHSAEDITDFIEFIGK